MTSYERRLARFERMSDDALASAIRDLEARETVILDSISDAVGGSPVWREGIRRATSVRLERQAAVTVRTSRAS